MSSDSAEPDHPLRGASVLLTGASGGLGSALAAELADRGATLTLVSRRRDALDALEVPGRREAIDLRTAEACERAVATAVEHGDGLDVVVNAVGVVAFGLVTELSVDAMEELFLTNTFVPILLARAALPRMGDGGAIVNLSGIVAEAAFGQMAAYGASKAAARAFGEGLAKEVRRSGLRILDARPPHTETGLADHPIEGTAPRFPTGLDPAAVAATICDALERGDDDLPSDAFGGG